MGSVKNELKLDKKIQKKDLNQRDNSPNENFVSSIPKKFIHHFGNKNRCI